MKWTKQAIEFLRYLCERENPPSDREIAQLIARHLPLSGGATPKSVERKRQSLGIGKQGRHLQKGDVGTLITEALLKENKALVQELVSFRDKSKKEQTVEGVMDVFVRKIQGVLPSLPPVSFSLPIGRARNDPETCVLLISDEQIGSWGKASETGFYDYNFDVFKQELDFLYRSVLKIVNIQRSAIPIKKLHIFFLGDHVENETIYKGQSFDIEADVMEQFFFGVNQISHFIQVLSKHFEIIDTTWISGNHGRVGRIGEHPWKVNWDYLFARFVQTELRENTRIKFTIPVKWWEIVDVMGWKFLLVHGEDIRRYFKLPWYDTRNYEADYARMLQSIGQSFTYLVFGHHHVPIEWDSSYGERICNGTFVGHPLYALKRLRVCVRPTQFLFFVHPKVGISSRYKVRLDLASKEKVNV